MYVFPKLQTATDVAKRSEKSHVRTSFDSQDSKGSQTLLKPAAEHFYHIFSITVRQIELQNMSLSYI